MSCLKKLIHTHLSSTNYSILISNDSATSMIIDLRLLVKQPHIQINLTTTAMATIILKLYRFTVINAIQLKHEHISEGRPFDPQE